jgi:hypothetical protein
MREHSQLLTELLAAIRAHIRNGELVIEREWLAPLNDKYGGDLLQTAPARYEVITATVDSAPGETGTIQ